MRKSYAVAIEDFLEDVSLIDFDSFVFTFSESIALNIRRKEKVKPLYEWLLNNQKDYIVIFLSREEIARNIVRFRKVKDYFIFKLNRELSLLFVNKKEINKVKDKIKLFYNENRKEEIFFEPKKTIEEILVFLMGWAKKREKGFGLKITKTTKIKGLSQEDIEYLLKTIKDLFIKGKELGILLDENSKSYIEKFLNDKKIKFNKIEKKEEGFYFFFSV